jgi:phosphatidylserine decarboxylase
MRSKTLETSENHRLGDAPQAADRLPLEPMDPQLTSIQPGGGVVIRLELAWGRLRRWYLKTFRPRYVERMRLLRQGAGEGCPHEVFDPRDVKFYRNQPTFSWNPEDDPFRWRERLPFARVGLAELVVFSAILFGGAAKAALLALWLTSGSLASIAAWLVAATLAVIGGLVVWFFRDPRRTVPQGPGLVVSPADGTIVLIEEIDHDDFVNGPAVVVGIFLSIFNVHINRAPAAARVIGLRYREGKCLNALRPESARENEQLAVRLEGSMFPHRRMVVRQITGALARRIVCWLKPGDELAAGEQFGMIKLGSRTELVLPRESGLAIKVKLGDKVRAGATIIAEYPDTFRNEERGE